MSEKTRFNVIIPTRERADVLFHCLRTVVNQDYGNLNIIVSDNFSQDDTRDVVRSFSDPRISYISPGLRMSMSSHWEFALSHVTDGFVTFLGDDDGLLPGALKSLNKIIDEFRPDSINAPCADYNWPENGTDKAWMLNIQKRRANKFYSSRQFLDDLMSGYLSYADGPLVYHGSFSKIDTINDARDSNGIFFKSQTPDVYSAVALSLVTERFLRLKDPIAVGGRSRHSNGSSAQYRGAPSAPFETFRKENDTPIHPVLGGFSLTSIQMLSYESLLQASHLHRLPTEMLAREMSLAVKLSAKDDRDDLVKTCHEIAKNNSISWKPTWRESRFCFWVFFVWREIRNEFFGLRTTFTTVDGKRYQLSDVYKASCWVAESRHSLSSLKQKWSSFRYKLSRLKTL